MTTADKNTTKKLRAAPKKDARTLSDLGRSTLRALAHTLRVQGHTQKEAAAVLGVHIQTIKRWDQEDRENPEGTTKAPRRRGVKPGTGRTLTPELDKKLFDIVTTTLPAPQKLWTREAVRALLAKELGKSVSTSLASLTLKRWGLERRKLRPLNTVEQNWRRETQGLVRVRLIKLEERRIMQVMLSTGRFYFGPLPQALDAFEVLEELSHYETLLVLGTNQPMLTALISHRWPEGWITAAV